MAPETHYVDVDGHSIAYQAHGSGPDIAFVLGLTSHVDLRWSIGYIRSTSEQLATFARTISFDRRGVGASERLDVERLPSWEDWADDLLGVLDALGSERTWLLANQDGSHYAMVFAAAHPDRVHGLMLINTCAKVLRDDSFPIGVDPEAAEAFARFIGEHWGTVEVARMLVPDEPTAWEPHTVLQRASSTPRVAEALVRHTLEFDAREIAAAISVPTFVFHREDQQIIPLELGRDLVDRIPGATWIPLPGDGGLLTGRDAPEVIDLLARIVTGLPTPARPDRRLAAILFTDIVSSTDRASRLGDQRWRSELDRHNEICEQVVGVHGGTIATSTGDGVVAIFDRPTRAAAAALDLCDTLAEVDLVIRGGLHVGEIDITQDDVGGLAVPVAQRIESVAPSGKVLASQIFVDLLLGSEFGSSPAGDHTLKGVPGTWPLHHIARLDHGASLL